MASDQEQSREIENEPESDEFECSEDSDDDPSFDVVEETRSALSAIRKVVDENLESESEIDAVESEIPKLDEKDEKSFEKVEELIKGPSCGTRTVAGRIVKESYGAAKQQHTFTMWDNEPERLKVLQEKHDRGFCARSSRDMRIQMKERRINGIAIKSFLEQVVDFCWKLCNYECFSENSPEMGDLLGRTCRPHVEKDKTSLGLKPELLGDFSPVLLFLNNQHDMQISEFNFLLTNQCSSCIVCRKNITAGKENQPLQRGNIQRRGDGSVLQHLPSIGSQILCRNNITGDKENNHLQTQQIGEGPILQQPLPSILGNPPPELAISSLPALRASLFDHRTHVSASRAPNSWNSGLMNHRDRQHYHHGRSHGFRFFVSVDIFALRSSKVGPKQHAAPI
ncbi:Zinc finger CCCH domain-containing protein 62 [Platanthera guangdongensis]|uniref:Zinc finger CCCH domain-containing protein 62 n=1 Tax=Platanthera guangdongensis TaxID=2320717 RepID=A0ABR2LJ90_9ASPA